MMIGQRGVKIEVDLFCIRDATMDWRERIVTDREILSGQPTVKGTGLAVAFILDRLADGESEAALLYAHQELCAEDIRACLRYASDRVAPTNVSPISDALSGLTLPHEAQEMLVKSDQLFKRYDYCAGSRILWETVVWAIQHVAAKRGWPAGDERELEQAMERLDAETGEQRALAGGFINALAVRDNAEGKWLHESDIEFFAELMPPFIEDIFTAAESLN